MGSLNTLLVIVGSTVQEENVQERLALLTKTPLLCAISSSNGEVGVFVVVTGDDD